MTWRGTFTFNKYSQIAARALRSSLKETERVAAEKRGATILRYQEWKDGQGGQLVCHRFLSRCFLTTDMFLPVFCSLHRSPTAPYSHTFSTSNELRNIITCRDCGCSSHKHLVGRWQRPLPRTAFALSPLTGV
ncbi:hypothetical protein PHLGIDRAFT_103662 [Phlebiopsis gigantea 11061_1 CR5-6]|uniref:Uncharacterized protein n=1 Tax=Phlebiopsis gigantea (strain 11061_1 CR5-6) TaxID=745531 RepID=A0A0C3SA40_PHLG1|nr:hypothetical protein PHLGIDRAFT_103662 [Phlebiopsis gigantea 11061_1 CR5-6]